MGMSGLYVGLSGLQTSSNSLNTTANNLSNVNTDGYVRQQVVDSDRAYNFVGTTSTVSTGQRGLGVSIASVNHVRDMFLDQSYRKEYGRQGFYDKLYDSVYEIETQMGETDYITGIGFQTNITDFLESLNELVKTPGDSTARASLVQSAVQFVDSAQTIYKGLTDYQQNLNTQVQTTVDRINEIGENLVDLNRRISKIESGGYETAADLRDQRDLLLDELSSYVKISYNEEDTGSVEVYIEGTKFADNLSYSKLATKNFEGTDLYDVVWPGLNDEQLYMYTETISTDKNTDIGGLKGLLIARGSITPTYADADATEPTPVTEPLASDYAGGTSDPAYIAAKEEYDNYLVAKNRYDLYQVSSETSTLVNTIANFDKLVTTMVTSINDILCPEKEITASDGTVYTVLDEDEAPVTSDGKLGYELFTRSFCDRYNVQTIDGQDYYVRNDVNTFGNVSSYTIMNISVNEDIIQDYSRIPLTKQDGSDDYKRAEELVNLFSDDIMKYNGSFNDMTFEQFYESLTNDVANTGKVYKSMSENEETLAEELDSQRLETMGVSSDEELGNMIKYQQAYNASSRYINVIDSMLETLINNLGAG